MAYKAFGTNDAETRKLWSTQVEKKSEQKAVFKQGSDISEQVGEAPIRRKTDLSKENEKGDLIRMTQVAPLSGDGVIGDAVMQGKGEALQTDTLDIKIDQIRHEVESGGRMSQKRTVLDFRKTGRDLLGQWHARKHDDARIIVLSGTMGVGATGSLKWSSQQVAAFAGLILVDADANHVVRANGLASAAAVSGDNTAVMSAKLLSKAKKRAMEQDTPVTPLIVDGEERFVVYVSPGQAYVLSYDTDFRNAQLNANIRGSKNPIFTGALGLYDGMIIKVLPRMIKTAANCTRALLVGADDVFEAFGMPENAEASPMSWNEETWDRGARKVITVGSIFGMVKNTYGDGGAWLNSIAIETYDNVA